MGKEEGGKEIVISSSKQKGSSLRIASRVARVARIARPVTPCSIRPTSSMTGITVVRCGGTLLEQGHPRFEGSDLLSFDILIHALSLQPTRARTFASARSLRLSSFERSDDEVVKFGQNVSWKKVDLELNLLGALRIEGSTCR